MADRGRKRVTLSCTLLEATKLHWRKVAGRQQPRVIPALRNFDIRDVLDKSHINFGSDEQRLFNLQVIKEAVSNLKGELVLRRDVRHHKMDFSDEWVQYRLRSPHWVDSTRGSAADQVAALWTSQ